MDFPLGSSSSEHTFRANILDSIFLCIASGNFLELVER